MPNAEGRKVALITGVCGQDGSYLTELLLEKGYIVHGKFRSQQAYCATIGRTRDGGFTSSTYCTGLKRRSSSFNHPRLEHILDKGMVFLLPGQTVPCPAQPLHDGSAKKQQNIHHCDLLTL